MRSTHPAFRNDREFARRVPDDEGDSGLTGSNGTRSIGPPAARRLLTTAWQPPRAAQLEQFLTNLHRRGFQDKALETICVDGGPGFLVLVAVRRRSFLANSPRELTVPAGVNLC